MNIRSLSYTTVLLGLILLVGCGVPETALPTDTNTAARTTAQPTAAAVNPSAHQPAVASAPSYEVIRSLDEAVAQAEIIVVGRVVGVGQVFNSARDNRDSTKPAPDLFDVAQEYTFQVERYLKGEGPKVLTIVQVEGAILSPPEKVTPADIQRAKAAFGVPQLTSDTQYVLLLKKDPDIDGKPRYGGLEPWRFALADDGTAGVVAPGHVTLSLPENFIPHPDAPLLPQVEQIIREQQTATP